MLIIVEIHQKSTGNNFAWAEVEYAKELLAQPEPEPVAWINGGIGGETAVGWYENDIANLPKGTKLYSAPPKREPLSDEVIMLLGKQNLYLEANTFKPFGFARAIEKAHGI